jgi:hypothetical protein
MGSVYNGQKCTHCEYEPGSFAHGFGFLGIFSGLATCRTCARIVGVSPDGTTIHKNDWDGDYQAHLNERRTYDIKFNTCRHCNGHDLIHHHLWDLGLHEQEGEISQNATFHLPCPRCATGKIIFVNAGLWD